MGANRKNIKITLQEFLTITHEINREEKRTVYKDDKVISSYNSWNDEQRLQAFQNLLSRGMLPYYYEFDYYGKDSKKTMAENEQTFYNKANESFPVEIRNSGDEDVIEKWENTEKGFVAYLLADGISNCDIGTGYIASNIIRKNFIHVLEEHINESFDDLTYDLVEQMAYQIVDLSNADIWEESLKFEESSGSIMGSTLIFLVIYEGGFYYYSLGDSLLYLIREGNMIPLNSPDNAGFLALRNGKSYAEYRKMEGKDNIAIYVGGDYARNRSSYYEERCVETIALKAGDIIIASSDGVLDYYGTKLSDTKWEKEDALAKKLRERKKTLQQRAKAIIQRDNRNGGGDNLSVILIEVEGGKDNE